MAITDPIGDLLARIRNGQLRGMAKVKPICSTNFLTEASSTA